MNGQRIARQYIERLSNEELHGLLESAKGDISYEAIIVTYLIECEIEERKERRMKEIMKALRELGVSGIVTTKDIDFDRFSVYVDGEYFGIWDTIRKTFVD